MSYQKISKDAQLAQLNHLGLHKKRRSWKYTDFLAPFHAPAALQGPTSDMDVAKRRGLTPFSMIFNIYPQHVFTCFQLYPIFSNGFPLFNLFIVLSISVPLDLQISVSFASVSRKLGIHLGESLDSTRMRFLLGDSEDGGHTCKLGL